MSPPTPREVIDRVLTDFGGDLHTSFPARVLAYDAAAQTVDVRPALQRELISDDPEKPYDFEDLPDLLSMQIMWPRAGGFAITFPIQVGDWVLVLCAEQSTLLWRSRATTGTPPGYVDPHGLNGCVALPGWFPDAQKLTNVSTTDLVIGNLESDATVRIKPDGTVVAGGEAGAGYVALAEKVEAEINAIWTALTTTNAINGSPLVPPTPPRLAGAVGATKVKAR